MSRWWWLVLIIQVASCKVLAQGEITRARGEGEGDCAEPDCKSTQLWSQESEIEAGNVLKREPLLSRWGSQRLSDLFYFDYKRRPAFSSWGGKRGPAFSSWGGKRSIRNTQNNDSASSNAWTQHSPPEHLTAGPNHILKSGDKLEQIDDNWNDYEDRNLHLYYFPQKDPLTPISSYVSSDLNMFDSSVPERNAYSEYIPFKEDRYDPRSITSFGIDDLSREDDKLSNFDGKRAAAFNSWGGKRVPAFNSWGGKRNAAFNSWGGKRAAAFNSWGGKRAAAFNRWGGKRVPELNNLDEDKRTAAFNSWGGKRVPELYNLGSDKRAAAFNSWGGKRAAAFNSWGGKRAAAFNSWGGKRASELYDLDADKRAAAFNSWGGKRALGLYDLDEDKRAAAFNSWGGKRAAAFNSWGGKRAAAFNSWGGKRAAAFNSWGGKRASELYDLDADKRAAAFNSWGGKRAAAFNSWGGKRAAELYNLEDDKRTAAFNSWGGKRVPAFNSWGGKRAAAFSSWGGKRAAAFNSWGGKRSPAFNSWGGKRSGTLVEKDSEPQNLEGPNSDESLKNNVNYTQQNALEIDTSDQTAKPPQESSSLGNLLTTYDEGISSFDSSSPNDNNEPSIREKRKRMTIRAGKRKPRFYSWGGKKRSESETDEYNDNENVSEEDYADEQIQDENEIENDNPMKGKFVLSDKNIEKRIDELFPTHSRSGFSGKRKPAFSSWGGKRSEPNGNDDEDKDEIKSRRKRNIMDENLTNEVWGGASNDLIDNSLFPTNTVTCCVKKLQYGDKNLFMQMLFRNNGFRDISWPTIRPMRRGADFYAWGGKRTSL